MLYKKKGTNAVVYAIKFDYEKWRQEGQKAYPMLTSDKRLSCFSGNDMIRSFFGIGEWWTFK